MRRTFIVKASVLVAVLSAALFSSSSAVVAAAADDASILRLVQAWGTDWNTHDMTAMGTLLTADADFVNVAGLHWKGREQIVREHAERHRTNLKLSQWTTRSTAIQQLSSDVALVHVNWGMTGDTDFDGTPREPREGIFTWLVLKRNGHWLIRAVQNTVVTPKK